MHGKALECTSIFSIIPFELRIVLLNKLYHQCFYSMLFDKSVPCLPRETMLTICNPNLMHSPFSFYHRTNAVQCTKTM